MKSIPVDFRHRLGALTDDGLTSSVIAEVLGVSSVWLISR